MKQKWMSVFWGLVMIFLGGLFLAQSFGYIPQQGAQFWVLAFAALGVFFLASYFLSGVRNWGWLFPALYSGAIALTLFMLDRGIEEPPFIGSLFLWCVTIPFLVAFFVAPRQNWWALIPAWATGVIGVILLLIDQAAGETIGLLVLLAIALPFVLVFILDRKQWWALIPGGVMLFAALMVVLSKVASGNVIGAVALFCIALPFFVVYFWSKNNWWGLIPAGIMASIGVMVLVIGEGGNPGWVAGVGVAILFLGMAATFAGLWLRRTEQPTDWARYPALVLGLAGVLSLVLGVNAGIAIPVVVILFGGWVLWRSLRPRRLT